MSFAGLPRFFRSSQALPALFVVSFAALVPSACGGNVIVDQPLDCTQTENQCGGECTDIKNDPNNCGGCGHTCATGSCTNGTCSIVVSDGGGGSGVGGAAVGGGGVGGSSCPPGTWQCGNDCVDLVNDPNNCGSCFNACVPEQICSNGGCVSVEPNCMTCGEFITGGTGEIPLCPGTSEMLYNNLVNCVCVGQCAFQCSDNICAGQDIPPECQDCIANTMGGCGKEFNACANDL